jgi:hypothetical protein
MSQVRCFVSCFSTKPINAFVYLLCMLLVAAVTDLCVQRVFISYKQTNNGSKLPASYVKIYVACRIRSEINKLCDFRFTSVCTGLCSADCTLLLKVSNLYVLFTSLVSLMYMAHQI